LAETVSARIAGIVAGVARAMMLSKLTTTSSLLIVAGLTAWYVSVGLAAPQAPQPRSATAPVVTPGSKSRTVAAAQPPAVQSRTGKTQAGDASTEIDLELLADLPAVVLSVGPKLGATNVDPDLREIRVTFSKPMMDKNWSWTGGGDTYPKS